MRIESSLKKLLYQFISSEIGETFSSSIAVSLSDDCHVWERGAARAMAGRRTMTSSLKSRSSINQSHGAVMELKSGVFSEMTFYLNPVLGTFLFSHYSFSFEDHLNIS